MKRSESSEFGAIIKHGVFAHASELTKKRTVDWSKQPQFNSNTIPADDQFFRCYEMLPNSNAGVRYRSGCLEMFSLDNMDFAVSVVKEVPDDVRSVFVIDRNKVGTRHQSGVILIWCLQECRLLATIQLEQFEHYLANNTRYLFIADARSNILYYDLRSLNGELTKQQLIVHHAEDKVGIEAIDFGYAVGERHLVVQQRTNTSTLCNPTIYLVALNDLSDGRVVKTHPVHHQDPIHFAATPNGKLYYFLKNSLCELTPEGTSKELITLNIKTGAYQYGYARYFVKYHLHTLDDGHVLIQVSNQQEEGVQMSDGYVWSRTDSNLVVYSIDKDQICYQKHKEGCFNIKVSPSGWLQDLQSVTNDWGSFQKSYRIMSAQFPQLKLEKEIQSQPGQNF